MTVDMAGDEIPALVECVPMAHIHINNTPHASHQNGAPWGVTFSCGGDALR
jgi:hypothetical protein